MRPALAFLTVLPVGATLGAARRTTLLAFPLVGLAMGCAWAMLAWGASAAWGPLVAAATVVALDLLLTGGLHADAVADVADGIASRREPEEALQIMREPQVGAAGAVAAGAVLLLRFAWLAALAEEELWALIAVVPICSRTGMVVALSLSAPGARTSLARGFAEAATPAVGAATVGLAALACLGAGRLATPGGGEALALAALAGALGVAVACERGWRRRFGSLTGDAAGAAGMAAELAALAIVALVPGVEG
jgi:adenosylcobinamide-GDP ribazoletransferase